MIALFKKHKELLIVIMAAVAMGSLGVWLAYEGNPKNSGICVSCFMENLAGALGFHTKTRMQCIRPELIGFILGGTMSAMVFKEFRAEGGSSPIIRFVGGVLLIVGCSMFLGCPIKMLLRLSCGDITATAGLVGLIFGVWLGYLFLRRGFHLGDTAGIPAINGLIVPLFTLGLLAAMVFKPSFLNFSTTGPGAQMAPLGLSLGAGLLIGFLAQRSRFCITGSIGNALVTGDRKMLWGVLSVLGSAFAVSYLLGLFNPGIEGQPGTHLSHAWSFGGMALVGAVSIMIGGCPFRQLILSSQGNADAAAAVLGMLAGGGIVQSWGITSSNLGPTPIGQAATLGGLACVLILGTASRVRE